MDDTEISSIVYTSEGNDRKYQVNVNFNKKWISKTASSRASDVEVVIYENGNVKKRILLALVGD